MLSVLAKPSEDRSVVPVVLNGFPVCPLNVPALKPDVLRENSCVAILSFLFWRKWRRGKRLKEEATTVSGDVAQKGSGHASQSPKCILGADTRGYCLGRPTMKRAKGQAGNLSHQIHPKVTMAGSKCLFPDTQKT